MSISGGPGDNFVIAEAATAPVPLTARIDAVPPHAYFVGSAIFHYLGPSFAVLLFARVDVLGVAWLRIASAALVFAVWRRPWRKFVALDRQGRLLIVSLGDGRRGRPRGGDAVRVRLRLPDRVCERGPCARRSGGDRRGNRGRRVIVRHPVRLRPTGDGPARSGDLRTLRRAAAGDGDRGRSHRPPPVADGVRGCRDRAGDGRDRTPPRGGLMDQVRLGSSGLHVSRLGLGMMSYGNDANRPWMLDEAAAEPIVRRAVEGGFTFFDTADMYSQGASEVATGRLLRKLLSRDELVIATKVYFPMTPGPNGRGLSRKHILSAIDASLQRLELEYVDLYQIHRWDSETPIEETMEALHDVVRSGKARYIGASSMYAWQFAKAQRVAERNGWTPFVSMQNHYNLIYREEEREMIPQCIDQGVGIIPWSPLARGFLVGTRTREGERRTRRSETDPLQDEWYGRPEDFDVVDRLADVAGQRGVPPAQVALAWLLHKPGMTAPIVGATKLGHLQDALAAAELELSPDEIARLEEPYRPHGVLGHGG